MLPRKQLCSSHICTLPGPSYHRLSNKESKRPSSEAWPQSMRGDLQSQEGRRKDGRLEGWGVCGCVSAEHLPLTCAQLESALHCSGKGERKTTPLLCLRADGVPAAFCASGFQEAQDPVPHCRFDVSLRCPRGEPPLLPHVTPVSDSLGRATNNPTRQSKVFGTQHPRTGFSEGWESGKPKQHKQLADPGLHSEEERLSLVPVRAGGSSCGGCCH